MKYSPIPIDVLIHDRFQLVPMRFLGLVPSKSHILGSTPTSTIQFCRVYTTLSSAFMGLSQDGRAIRMRRTTNLKTLDIGIVIHILRHAW